MINRNGKNLFADQRLIDLIALLFVLAIFLFTTARAINEYRWSYWAYGDAQMLNAGIHFRDDGFLKHYFLPLVNPGYIHDLIPNNLPIGHYTHYPALHAVIIGMVGHFLEDPLILSRLVAVFFGSLSLLFWYLFARKTFGRGVALLSSFFIGLSIINLEFIDALCGQPYDEFFRFSVLFLFVTLASIETTTHTWRRFILAVLICLLLLLESLNSIEYIVYLWLFIFGYYYLNQKLNISRHRMALFFFAPIIGFLLHFVQTVFDYGGIKGVIQDWGSIIINRITAQAAGVHPASRGSYCNYLVNLLGYFVQYLWNNYKLAIVASIPFLIFSAVQFKKNPGSLYDVKSKILLLLLLCGISFYILLPFHSYLMRDYSFKHIFPFFAILFALSGSFYLSKFIEAVKSDRKILQKWFRLICFLAGFLFTVHPFIETAKYVMQYPNLLDSPKWAMNDKKSLHEWVVRIDQARFIRANTMPGDIVMVPQSFGGNSTLEARPIEEYYAQRHLIPMGAAPSELLERLHRLYKYKKDFVTKEPRLQNAQIWIFVDKQGISRSLLYFIANSFRFSVVDSGGRLLLAKIKNIPDEPTLRPAGVIFSEAKAIWKFDDKSPKIVADAKGRYNAVAYNTKAVPGILNKARWFDGASSYINTSLILNEWKVFSIGFWVKPEPKNNGEIAIILDNGHDAKENFVIQSDNSSETSWMQSTFKLPAYKWTYVALVVDITDNKMEVFLDGEKRAITHSPSFSKAKLFSLTFGKWATENTRYFKGSLDEIAIWDYQLDADDVRSIFNFYKRKMKNNSTSTRVQP
jgi:hypothetical protein